MHGTGELTMDEYIERDAVLSLAKDICVPTKWDSEYRLRSIDPGDVKGIPSADVQPVRHGRWERREGDSRWMCSLCKGKENVPTIMGKPIVWDFCPNCGAQMDGGET